MNNFNFRNPTRLIFGDGVLEQLTEQAAAYSEKVLLVYGGGSVKRSGLYDKVIAKLAEANKEVFELSGVEPNPRLTTVERGITMCKDEDIGFILAVGGGSVIDCVKAIAIGGKHDGKVWDIMTGKDKATEAIPFGTILTLAATGSEMNPGSVITDWETKEKRGWGNPLVYPQFSILDPRHTMTVPRDQTMYGIVDIMSHVIEQYFHSAHNTPIQDGYMETILRTMIEIGPKLLNDLTNYDYRETVLYCGTVGFNGTLSMGLQGDWATHQIEHAVSAVYDIPHAGGLSILFPNWMRHVLQSSSPARFVQLATRVFEVEVTGKTDKQIAMEGITALSTYWTSLGAPNRLADYGIDDGQITLMTERAMIDGEFGGFKKLQYEDVRSIYEMSL